MADSPEHQFISRSFDNALSSFSQTKLLGLQEAERRKFDYSCMLLRDFSRPLVSQVLWTHSEGIEKDIRTLLFDGQAALKVYFVRDSAKSRAKIDEIRQTYRANPSTIKLLRGLRIITVPEFDADSEAQRAWMNNYIHRNISADLLFGVVFGKLTAPDVITFSNHAGPFGLKFATLHEITLAGLLHGPSFEKAVGAKGSPLREALAMLGATGLVGVVPHTILKVPSLKGRFLLDFCKRLMFEKTYRTDWSPELKDMVLYLGLKLPRWEEEINYERSRDNQILELLSSMTACKRQYGRDLMAGIDPTDPKFHSDFLWKSFANDSLKINGDFWNDNDDLDLFHS